MMPAALRFLDFEHSEDEQGQGCLDALASVAPQQLPALLAEVAGLLQWAQAEFADGPGPLDEGCSWDYALACQQEWSVDEGLQFDLASGRFRTQPQAAGPVRHTLSLSLSGSAPFCDALREAFGLA